jgi:hypothetical protein
MIMGWTNWVAAEESVTDSHPILPNPNVTTGVFLADATLDKICQKGYSATVRHVTDKQKDEVFKEYNLERSGNYEVDHLISLELGGSNDTHNLWPQSYHGFWNARVKDSLENRLHLLVCDGKMNLRDAQYRVSHDWIKTYCYVFNDDKCKGVNIE